MCGHRVHHAHHRMRLNRAVLRLALSVGEDVPSRFEDSLALDLRCACRGGDGVPCMVCLVVYYNDIIYWKRAEPSENENARLFVWEPLARQTRPRKSRGHDYIVEVWRVLLPIRRESLKVGSCALETMLAYQILYS